MFMSGVLFMLGMIVAALAVRLTVAGWVELNYRLTFATPRARARRKIAPPLRERWLAMSRRDRIVIWSLGLLFAFPLLLAIHH